MARWTALNGMPMIITGLCQRADSMKSTKTGGDLLIMANFTTKI